MHAAALLAAALFVHPACLTVGLDVGEGAEDAFLPEALLSEDECLARGAQHDCALHALQVKVRAIAAGRAAPTPSEGTPSTAPVPPAYPPEPTFMPQAVQKEDASDASDAGGNASDDHAQGPPGGVPNFEIDVYPPYPPEQPFMPYSEYPEEYGSEYGSEYPEFGSEYAAANDTAGNSSNMSNESGEWVPYPPEEPYLSNGAHDHSEDDYSNLEDNVLPDDGWIEEEPQAGWEPSYGGPAEYPEELAPEGYYIDDGAAPPNDDYADFPDEPELGSDGYYTDAEDDYQQKPPEAVPYYADGDAYDGGVPPEDLQEEPDILYDGPGPDSKESGDAPSEGQESP